jgi:hypothetical protein
VKTTRPGSDNPYGSLPPPAKDLTNALLGEAESGGQAHNGFAPLIASPDLLIAMTLSRRVIGEGHRWHFLTKIHEARPVAHRVHKMLECPASRAPPPPVSALTLQHTIIPLQGMMSRSVTPFIDSPRL